MTAPISANRTLAAGRLILLLAIVLAYSNSFDNGFHFDDFHTVTDNPAVRSLKQVPRFFTDATTFSVLPANRTYRPVVSTSLAFDYAMGQGYKPFWFHVSTFLLFLLEVVLLEGLFRRLMEAVRPSRANAWLALLGAAWFGLHPAMAETVNYVIQRGDLYCTLGCVAALYCFVRWPARRRQGLYLLPFVFALLSKPPAAVFPVLLLLYCFFFEHAADGTARRWRKAGVAVLPALGVMVALLVLESAMTPKTFTPSMVPPWDYRLVQPYVWLRYFGALFLPLHLNVDSDLTPIAEFNLQALAGLVFLAALCAAVWATARRRALYPVAYGLLWFVVTQLPTSLYPLSEVENDHRMFFSFVGLVLAAVWSAWLLVLRLVAAPETRRKLAPVLGGVAVLALVGYGYGVRQRNFVWATETSLWLDDTLKSPHNGRGLMIYGLTQMNVGAYPAALDYFTRALLYTPNYATLETNLAIVNGAMADQGDTARGPEAERHFQRALSLTPKDDSVHSFYAQWLLTHNRADEAIQQLKLAIALDPPRSMQHDLLMAAYSNLGDRANAVQAAKDTLKAIPDDAVALQTLANGGAPDVSHWINLSLAQYTQGKYAESIASAREALKMDPKSAVAYNNLGAAYGAMAQWQEGIASEQEALRLNPDLQIAKNNLAWYQRELAAGHAVAGHAASPVAAGPAAAAAGANVTELINESARLSAAGKYEESLAVSRKALKLDPHSAEAWNNIAANNEAMHHWDEAIVAAGKAIALKPDFQLAKNNLAWSLAQKKAGVR